MAVFNISVTKQAWASNYYEVEADTPEEARRKARELANADEDSWSESFINNAEIDCVEIEGEDY